MKTSAFVGNMLLASSFLAASVVGINADDSKWDPDPQAKEIAPYEGQEPDMNQPVQVFVLLGQSNMFGFGRTLGSGDRTLETAVKEEGLYPYLVDENGDWVTRQDVRNVQVRERRGSMMTIADEWMTITDRNIGPEVGIGWHLGNLFDAPVLLIKSCVGNRALGWDLLPPGTPSYAGEPGYRGTRDNPEMSDEKPESGWYAGKQYDDDTDNALKILSNLDDYIPGATDYEVAGFFWWQGDRDMRSSTYSEYYETNLVQLVKALRETFDSPNAKFVSATLGQTSLDTGGNQGKIRDAKFNIADPEKYPEFAGHVATVFTNPLSKGGSSSGHYNGHAQTYMNVGEAMGWAMAQMLEGSSGARGAAGPEPRRIAPDNFDQLQSALQRALADLSEAGKLQEIPLSISPTAATVWLKGAASDGTLTFGMVEGSRTADLPWSSMEPEDQAILARLAVHLDPDNENAAGIAGVYTEILGDPQQAGEMFSDAGDARARWEGMLQ